MQSQGQAAGGHTIGPADHVVIPGESVEHGHPNALRYVQIALVLAALTAVEVTVYYVKELQEPLVPILLVLSTIKFALVVLFYMHLKFDNKLFSALFTLGLGLAASLMLGLLTLFHAFLFAGGI